MIIYRINPVALKPGKPLISDTSIYIKAQIRGKMQAMKTYF